MDKHEAVLLLFEVAREIKRSFESPVILLTLKDYADYIFNSLVDLRSTLLQNGTPEQIMEIVNIFHIEWLQAVQDIENFKKRAKDTPRAIIIKSIDYSMECVKKRYIYFQKYIERLHLPLTEQEKNRMLSDIETIGDMRDIVNFALIEKQKCLRCQADKCDFNAMIMHEIDELLNWLDRLTDHLAVQFIKVLDVKHLQLINDLTEALQHTIDEVANYPTPEAQNIAEKICRRGQRLGSMIHVSSFNDREIKKVIEKIKNLEERINHLQNQNSSAVTALQHKTMYLEDRLESLENLKLSLSFLRKQKTVHRDRENRSIGENEDIHIFNHLIPHQERYRLVDKLIKLWQGAICDKQTYKSNVSVLSAAADIKSELSDELGHFRVDRYGRKIYTREEDNKVYQLNEKNELVPVKDDEKHVYFYDECGRYYLTENKERVYKAHRKASEYMLHRAGIMLKIGETEDDIDYKYDNVGRYYIDDEGNRIYRERGSKDEYRHDGFGNLVKIRDEAPVYKACPVEPILTEENMYLKNTVGEALKICLAEVVVIQPPDPIKYLADRLVKYRYSIEAKQTRLIQKQEIMAERERLVPKEHTSPPISFAKAEESEMDFNSTEYESTLSEY